MLSLCRRIRDRFAGALVLAATRLDVLYEEQLFERLTELDDPADLEFTRIDRQLSRWAARLERWGMHMMGELTISEKLSQWLVDEPVAIEDLSDDELLAELRKLPINVLVVGDDQFDVVDRLVAGRLEVDLNGPWQASAKPLAKPPVWDELRWEDDGGFAGF